MNRHQAIAYRRKIESAAAQQTDEQALESIELFPKWTDKLKEAREKGKGVGLGLRVQDEGKLWKCIQPHVPQAGWNPSLTPALWKEVSLDEWPEIPENIPSTAPWMAGDKGTWKGQHYICNMNNCVWNPDVLPSAWDLQP